MWTFGAKYGVIAGFLTSGAIVIGFVLSAPDALAEPGAALTSQLFGYAIMLLALSLIYFATRRYRDTVLGGVISFGQAFKLGVIVSAIAAVTYVITWEIYSYFAANDFIENYTNGIIAQKQAEGITGTELEAEVAKMEKLKTNYANPLFRIPVTFSEIFPVGFLVSLITAAILRTRHN